WLSLLRNEDSIALAAGWGLLIAAALGPLTWCFNRYYPVLRLLVTHRVVLLFALGTSCLAASLRSRTEIWVVLFFAAGSLGLLMAYRWSLSPPHTLVSNHPPAKWLVYLLFGFCNL